MRICNSVCEACYQDHRLPLPLIKLIILQHKRSASQFNNGFGDKFYICCLKYGRTQKNIRDNYIPEGCGYATEHTLKCEMDKNACIRCRNSLGIWWLKWSNKDDELWSNKKLRCPAFLNYDYNLWTNRAIDLGDCTIKLNDQFVFSECFNRELHAGNEIEENGKIKKDLIQFIRKYNNESTLDKNICKLCHKECGFQWGELDDKRWDMELVLCPSKYSNKHEPNFEELIDEAYKDMKCNSDFGSFSDNELYEMAREQYIDDDIYNTISLIHDYEYVDHCPYKDIHIRKAEIL